LIILLLPVEAQVVAVVLGEKVVVAVVPEECWKDPHLLQ
jgi:hypothetical protein